MIESALIVPQDPMNFSTCVFLFHCALVLEREEDVEGEESSGWMLWKYLLTESPENTTVYSLGKSSLAACYVTIFYFLACMP